MWLGSQPLARLFCGTFADEWRLRVGQGQTEVIEYLANLSTEK
jgi:hypothetical protein